MDRRQLKILLRLASLLGLLSIVSVSCVAKRPRHEDPVRLMAGYLLTVPVSINGRGPWEFVVDTGTNETVIDPNLATELGVNGTKRVVLDTLAGRQTVSLARAESISVEDRSLNRQQVLVGEIDAVRRLDGRIRGILGLDFLYHFAFSLDYEHAQLRLNSLQTLADPEDSSGERVHVRLLGGRLLVPCAWRGSGERFLALDSGIAYVLLFESDQGGSAKGNEGRTTLTTNASSTEAARTKLRDLFVGGKRLRAADALVLPRAGELKGLDEDGLLPASLFRSVFVNPRAQTATFREK